MGYEVELWTEGKYFLTIVTKQKPQESGITCEEKKESKLNWHLGQDTIHTSTYYYGSDFGTRSNFYITVKNNVCRVKLFPCEFCID